MSTLPPWGNQWPLGYGRYSAESLSVICACIDVISSALASLPAIVYERMPDGTRREAPQHPVQRLVSEPNALQTWGDLVRFLMSQVLLNGNALVEILRDGSGQPSELRPIMWSSAQPLILPSGRLCFDVVNTPIPGGGSGVPRRLFADAGEVFFLRERSDTGYLGVSRLARAAQVVDLSLNAQGFASTTFAQGAVIAGVLRHPGRLAKEASDNLAESWRNTHSGPSNAAKALILEEGMTFEPQPQMTLESAQLAATREFQATELSRLYSVPPELIGIRDDSNFATSQQAAVFFATNCLNPWVTCLQLEASRSLFLNDRFCLELDLSGLLRGSYGERAQTTIALTRGGLLTQNEGRAELGYDPLPGGDQLIMAAVGGRPAGTGDGQGDSVPAPGGSLNGSGDGAIH
jgi:HK97 family phage portal protein